MSARRRPLLGALSRRLWRRTNQVKFLRPGKEGCGRLPPLLIGLRALEPVEHLVAIVDAGSALVVAQQRHRVAERANDAAVAEVRLRPNAIFASLRHC